MWTRDEPLLVHSSSINWRSDDGSRLKPRQRRKAAKDSGTRADIVGLLDELDPWLRQHLQRHNAEWKRRLEQTREREPAEQERLALVELAEDGEHDDDHEDQEPDEPADR